LYFVVVVGVSGIVLCYVMCGSKFRWSWQKVLGRALGGVSRMSLYDNQLMEGPPEVGSMANLQEL
jgi:hypothetical protein